MLPRSIDPSGRGRSRAGAGSTILAFADSMADITRIEAAFSAVAADTELPGRVAVVEPRDRGTVVLGTA